MRYLNITAARGFNATLPAIPQVGAHLIDKDAVKFSLLSVDGRLHRFALTVDDAKWLLATFIDALFPRAGRLLSFWLYRANRGCVQQMEIRGAA